MTGAVVVTHNCAATIGACLASLRAGGCRRIVVIDNASTDETIQNIAADAMVIRNPTNYGFGAACNQGAARLNTPYLLFLNPDAVLSPAAVPAAARYLDQHAAVGALGLQLLDSQDRPQAHNFGGEITLGSLIRRKVAATKLPTTAVSCAWVSGAALLCRRTAFMAVGGFDPDFFMYWEDVDLCRRLRIKGWKIIFWPQGRAVHQRGHSSPDLASKTDWYDQSADRYFRKHYATTIWLLHRFGRALYRWLVPQVH